MGVRTPYKIKIKTYISKKISNKAREMSFSRIIEIADSAPIRDEITNSENAIIIQGPILAKEHIYCIKATAAKYPNEAIILSTWNDTDKSLLEQVLTYVNYVVLNEKPAIAGFANINMQLTSTKAGLEKALEIGAKFAMKTRVDTVINKANLFEHYKKVIRIFDNIETLKSFGLVNRLMMFEPRAHIDYFIQDFFMLGYTVDMLKFWQAPLDERDLSQFNGYNTTLSDIIHNKYAPEIWLTTSLLERIGRKITYCRKDSHDFIRDFFYVINAADVKWFWLKRPWEFKMVRRRAISSLNMSHYDWLNLYMNVDVDIHNYNSDHMKTKDDAYEI